MTTTRIRTCGEAALLLDCADLAEAVALAERIEQARIGAVDVVAAARTVLVTVRRPYELPQLRRALEALLAHPTAQHLAQPVAQHLAQPTAQSRNPPPSDLIRDPGRGGGSACGAADLDEVVTLDVQYDGPDLADVAELAGISTDALVRLHTSITWKAAFGGFAPGFFYLVDARELDSDADAHAARALDAPGTPGTDMTPGTNMTQGTATTQGTAMAQGTNMTQCTATTQCTAGENDAAGPTAGAQADPGSLPTVPRLGSPRLTVPAGSVAVADRFCAVYPGASPGGWRLLGTTQAPMWDVDRPHPALLAPGTLVRFRDLATGVQRAGGEK